MISWRKRARAIFIQVLQLFIVKQMSEEYERVTVKAILHDTMIGVLACVIVFARDYLWHDLLINVAKRS